MLLAAATRLEPLDASLARETYLEAIASAMFAGRLGTGPDEREVAEAARTASRGQSSNATDGLLDALVTRFTDGYAAGTEPLSRALHAFAGPGEGAADGRWLWLACRLAQDLWDDELWHALASRGVRLARETGALHLLPNAANYLAVLNVHSGAFSTAAVLVDEVEAITQATGLPPLKYAALTLAAARGDQADLLAIAEVPLRGAMERGEGSALGGLARCTALLHNGHGHYGEALAAAREGCEHEDVIFYGWSLVELVEAGVRSGESDEAAAALDRLTNARRLPAQTGRSASRPAPAALLSEGGPRLIRRRSSGSPVPAPRSTRARASSSTASGCVVSIGGWTRASSCALPTRCSAASAREAFAERARRELSATGETVRKRTVDTRDELTAAGGADRPARRATGRPTRRSAPSSSSARARSSGTCARSSQSSVSVRARSCDGRSRRPSTPACPPSLMRAADGAGAPTPRDPTGVFDGCASRSLGRSWACPTTSGGTS